MVLRFTLTEYAGSDQLSWRISFLSLARQWDGWYQLEAASQGRPLPVEPSHVEVRVEGPPVFSSQEDQQDQEVVLACSQTVRLTCQAGGQPTPETVWQRQTDRGDLAPPVLSDYTGLAGNGSILVLTWSDKHHQETAGFINIINYL